MTEDTDQPEHIDPDKILEDLERYDASERKTHYWLWLILLGGLLGGGFWLYMSYDSIRSAIVAENIVEDSLQAAAAQTAQYKQNYVEVSEAYTQTARQVEKTIEAITGQKKSRDATIDEALVNLSDYVKSKCPCPPPSGGAPTTQSVNCPPCNSCCDQKTDGITCPPKHKCYDPNKVCVIDCDELNNKNELLGYTQLDTTSVINMVGYYSSEVEKLKAENKKLKEELKKYKKP